MGQAHAQCAQEGVRAPWRLILASATLFAACFVTAFKMTTVPVLLLCQDEREAVYSLQELEEARTHDDLWVCCEIPRQSAVQIVVRC